MTPNAPTIDAADMVHAASPANGTDRLAEPALRAALAAIDRSDREIGAMVGLRRAEALREAEMADRLRRAGRPAGPLHGTIIAIKDNVDVAGMATTAGLAIRRHHMAGADAACVRRLREAGGTIIGKTNMPEAGLGPVTENPIFGRTVNPRAAAHTSGGSSGGSAAAVAAGFCDVAIGTDTMGSVRIPASFCGVVGVKPAWGAIDPAGVVPMARELDHIGLLARSVAEAQCALRTLTNRDTASSVTGTSNSLAAARVGFLNLTGGTLANSVQACFATVRAIVERLAHQYHDVTLEQAEVARARHAAFLISEVGTAVTHAAEFAADPESFSAPVASMLRYGSQMPATRLYRAQAETDAMARRMDAIFAGADVILSPTTPLPAPRHGEPMPDTVADYTVLGNIARCGALSLPIGLCDDSGMPIGLQIMVQGDNDALLFAIARQIEAMAAFDTRAVY